MSGSSTRRWILVTGSPRSGTTAVGEVVAQAAGALELYEPMNVWVGDRGIVHDFEVPGSAELTHRQFADFATRLQNRRLDMRHGVFPSDRGWIRMVKHVTGSRATMTARRYRWTGARRDVVWKDPFAAFCVRDLPTLLPGLATLVTFREAAAVAGSFHRLGWWFDVRDLEARLTRSGYQVDALPDLDYSQSVLSGVGTWLLVYGWLTRYAPEQVVFLHNAALSRRDEATLDRASELLRLPRSVAELVPVPEASTSTRLETVPSGRAHSGNRDTSTVNTYWRELLDEPTAALIDEVCGPVWAALESRAVRG